MYRGDSYRETDKMSDLICKNYPMLLIMRRFDMPLGFGEKTVGEVCRENGVHVATFLTIVNFLAGDSASPAREPKGDLSSLIEGLLQYLENSHDYFLEFRFPLIREKLKTAIEEAPDDISFVIRQFFDEYTDEVQKHMDYEEEVVFPYARKLLQGEKESNYNISVFVKNHSHIDSKLAELKNLLIKYYPGANSDFFNSVLFDLFTTEEDLFFHHRIEENLFVPAVLELEETS